MKVQTRTVGLRLTGPEIARVDRLLPKLLARQLATIDPRLRPPTATRASAVRELVLRGLADLEDEPRIA
ncbi:MAG: hypothetical protein HYV07_21550 [Deltaproteobacteria bacterium]|nr:hypothetical protein [Deltaproteobacteria bacterium]